jgi:hypothetical protein
MPSAANITVKKNDGTTDIVWSLVNPAGADGQAATWRSDTIVAPMAGRPTMTFKSRNNGRGNARRCDLEVVFPQVYTETTTSLVKTANKAIATLSFLVPMGMDTTQLNEAVAQAMNLFASSLIKQSVQSGYAPN